MNIILIKKPKIVLSFLMFLFLVNCSVNNNRKIIILKQAPETKIVHENGSRPPEFYKVLKEANIDFNCLKCNSQNRYSSELKPFSKISAKILLKKISPFVKNGLNEKENKSFFDILEDHVMWAMVRGVLIEGNNNNLGAVRLKGYYWIDEKGKRQPLIIFRSAFTPYPKAEDSCFRSLLSKGKVKHIINLYDGDMNLNDLIEAERETAKEYGATYVRTAELDYGRWRYTIRKHPEEGEALDRAKKNVARLIREQILNPQGAKPRGNILIHCGGGMHRTGMIMGLLMRIINKSPKSLIINTYKYHTGYRNEKRKGGYERANLDFILNFSEKL